MVSFATKERTCASTSFEPQRSSCCGSACRAAVWQFDSFVNVWQRCAVSCWPWVTSGTCAAERVFSALTRQLPNRMLQRLELVTTWRSSGVPRQRRRTIEGLWCAIGTTQWGFFRIFLVACLVLFLFCVSSFRCHQDLMILNVSFHFGVTVYNAFL